MTRHFFIFALLGVSASPKMASALPFAPSKLLNTQCDLVHDINFVPAEQAFKALMTLLELLTANIKLRFGEEENDNYCSGNVVSDDGQILTARHCIEHCLRNQGIKGEKVSAGKYRRPDVMKKTNLTCAVERYSLELLQSVQCPVIVNGVHVVAKIISASRCESDAQSFCDLTLVNKICPDAPDFAILKVDGKVLANNNCIKVSSSDLKLGEDIDVVGFPAATRGRELNSNGMSQFVSMGKAIDFDQCWAPDDKSSFPLKAKKDGLVGGLRQVSADFTGGDSGGSLIRERTGELVGIPVSVDSVASENRECQGAGFVVTTSDVLRTLKSQGLDANLVFNCRAKAIKNTGN